MAAFICSGGWVVAAVAPGENLLLNGALEAEQLEFPQFWGFSGIIVHNRGWYSSQGILNPKGTSDGWQLMERSFKLTSSEDGSYGVAIFAKGFKGTLRVAEVRLEAVSAGALAGSEISPALLEQVRPRLVPWSPLLNRVPLSEPRLSFHLFGRPGEGKGEYEDYECVFTLDGRGHQRAPLQPGLNTVDLKGVAAGDHRLECAVVRRGDAERLFAMTNTITLIELPSVDTSSHRRLNNFVTEILARELAAQTDPLTFAFDNPREGWVYIALNGGEGSGLAEVALPGIGTVVGPDSQRSETFRHLPMGRQRLTVRNAPAGTKLVVRSIAEIFTYPACANSQIPQNGKYDWEFFRQHVLHAATTLNGGSMLDEHLPELRARGLKWLANLGTTSPRDTLDLLTRLEKSAGLTHDKYDGVTCDEQFFSHPGIFHYTEALRRYENPRDRLIYTWIVGKPMLTGLHNDFISAALNASRGRGRLLYEAYCHSRPDEEDARTYLHARIVETMESFRRYHPEAAPNTGIILGNFNQIPVISLDVNPEVDYKYYLDMQVNLVANHAAFENLGTIGYWGSYYDDEELYRWSFQLMRHYCVEGAADMLSTRYGYRHNPGHLRNCDFINGMEGWQTRPAVADSIVPASFSGYGKESQNRWGCPRGTGDTFCLFKRQESGPNLISQQVTGLVPGKIYTLQFVTADRKDMLEKRFNPRLHGIKATLGAGAAVIPEKSYVFLDKRNSNKKKDDGKARVNLHHIRFRATAAGTTLEFSDAAATPGEELALNYVMLKPYFEAAR